MTTTKSYSNGKRFWSNYLQTIKQSTPFMIVNTMIFALIILLPLWLSYDDLSRWILVEFGKLKTLDPSYYYSSYRSFASAGVFLGYEHSIMFKVAIGCFSILSALLANSYMHSKKKVDLFHAVPLKRSQLIMSNSLAGLTLVALPFTLIYLIAGIIEVIAFGKYLPSYFYTTFFIEWLHIIAYLPVVYFFVTFIATNVGNLFDNVVTAAVIGFIPLSLYFSVGTFWGELIYGAYFTPNEKAIVLSPYTAGFYNYFGVSHYDYTTDYKAIIIGILICVLYTAVFAYLSVFCYTKRKSEFSGEKSVNSWPQTIVKFFIGFYATMFFYFVFERYPLALQLIFATLCGLVIVSISEIILSRGVQNFKKNLVWVISSCLAFCVLFLALKLDFMGFEKTVPNPDKVASVGINYTGRFADTAGEYVYRFDYDISHGNDYDYYSKVKLTEAESIRIVTDTHKLITENPPGDDYNWNYYDGSEEFEYNNLYIVYTLENGRTIRRRYDYVHHSALEKISDLEAQQDFIQANSPIYEQKFFQNDEMTVSLDSVKISDVILNSAKDITSKDDRNAILEAVKQDMLNESLSGIKNPTSPSLCQLEFVYKRRLLSDDMKNTYDETISTVVVTEEYTNTIAVLKKLGFDDMFAIDTSDIAYATVLPIDRGDIRVNVFTSTTGRDGYYYNNNYNSYSDKYLNDFGDNTFVIEKKNVIENFTNNAILQTMITKSNLDNKELFYVSYYDEDKEYIGSHYVKKSSLYPDVQKEITIWYEQIAEEIEQY